MDYVATSLQLNPQNKYIAKDFRDIIKNEPQKSGEEIVQDVVKGAGLIIEE